VPDSASLLFGRAHAALLKEGLSDPERLHWAAVKRYANDQLPYRLTTAQVEGQITATTAESLVKVQLGCVGSWLRQVLAIAASRAKRARCRVTSRNS
jgi:hypothetical protein